MVITAVQILFVFIGFFILLLCRIFPILFMFFMDWIALIVVALGVIIGIIRLSTSRTLKLFEPAPVGKEKIIFLRRDGSAIPTYAKRPYYGESFLEVPKVGLIHDLGKGSVYRLGKENIRFALENVNHTPDPRFANFTSWLYELGFENMKQVKDFLKNNGNQDVTSFIPETPEDSADMVVEDVKKLSSDMELKKVHGFLDKIKVKK